MTPFQLYLEAVNRSTRLRHRRKQSKEIVASLGLAALVWLAIHYFS